MSSAAAATPASGRKQRKAWTEEEEDIMVHAIKTYGADFHKFVPLLPDRNIRQIRKHYADKKHIYDAIEHGGIGKKQSSSKKTPPATATAAAAAAPDSAAETTPKRMKKGQWSDEEEALFIHQLQKYGKRFSKFTIPGRTKFALSSHYYVNKAKYESIDLPSVKKTRNSTITTTSATSPKKKSPGAASKKADEDDEDDEEEETESPKKRKASSSKETNDEDDGTPPDERETQRRRLNDDEGEGLKYIPLFAKNTFNNIKSYCTNMYNRWIG